MPGQTREAFTSLEIYREVEDGADRFLDHVHDAGDQIYGNELRSVAAVPTIEEDDEAGEEMLMSVRGIERPRLDVFRATDLRLEMLERSAPARLNYGSSFRTAAGKLIRSAGYKAHRPIKRSPEEEEAREASRRRESLANKLYQIGLKFDVVDQKHLPLWFHAVGLPIDITQDNQGQEVALIPDPKDRVTMMLVEQSKMCLRGLGMLSAKAAYPTSRTGLQIPFARLPLDASPEENSDFLKAVEEQLPVRLTLGGFKDDVHASSW